MNIHLESNLQNPRKQKSYFQYNSANLTKFTPAFGVNREVHSLLLHLAHLYKLLKEVPVPLEQSFQFRVFTKFAPMHSRANRGSLIFICFDLRTVLPPKMYWITSPRWTYSALGIFIGSVFSLIAMLTQELGRVKCDLKITRQKLNKVAILGS